MSTGIVLTGKRGDGKSLAAVGRMQQYLREGRRVATNLNLFLEHLLPPDNRTAQVWRLPDHPTIRDLEALPRGNDTKDEERNGLLVLDEAATWLNSRTWNDNAKERQAVISWFLHSRKYGWDLLILAQHQSLLDKQLREALFEFHGLCKRLDKIAIPFVTPIAKLFELKVRPPKVHIAVIRYGLAADAPISDRWIYRGHALYSCYDTNQVITPEGSPGLHSLLTPWHLKGRYLGWFRMYSKVMLSGLMLGLVAGLFAGWLGLQAMGYRKPDSSSSVVSVEKDVRLLGYTLNGAVLIGLLSDGRTVETTEYEATADGFRIKAGNKWYQGGKSK
jgi:hypothetical protein